MSVTPTAAPLRGLTGPGAPRRVRHQAGEALALMAFSAVSSIAIAAALLLLPGLGR